MTRRFHATTDERAIFLTRQGITFVILPLTFSKELDRLHVLTLWTPREDHIGSGELKLLAQRFGATQNFFRVFVKDAGGLAVTADMTFYDEFTAQEFDAFLDLYGKALRQHVLTKEARSLLE